MNDSENNTCDKMHYLEPNQHIKTNKQINTHIKNTLKHTQQPINPMLAQGFQGNFNTKNRIAYVLTQAFKVFFLFLGGVLRTVGN